MTRLSPTVWNCTVTFALGPRPSVEMIFPNWLLLECLDRFGRESPHTRIELVESVIGGTPEAIERGDVQLAITARLPAGLGGEPLVRVRFVAAAHPEHPLHRLQRKLSMRDLRAHRHLVVRDTGSARSKSKVSIDAAERWTVSQLATSIEAARMGFGFASFLILWVPVLNLLLIPLANVGGTLLFLGLKQGGGLPAAARSTPTR
jgi:DNA-binding transcriptional LysR family regulator